MKSAACARCGGPVDQKPVGRPRRYCSTKCRMADYHERAKRDGRYEQWNRAAVERRAADRAANARPRPYCGDLMLNPRRVQCGKPDCERAWKAEVMRTRYAHLVRAHKKRREALIRGASSSEAFTSEEIFERDGWRCGICGQKVDRRLRYPHRRSASLDHIIPVTAGGGHVRENVQCAHLECNWRKNASGPGQLLLVG